MSIFQSASVLKKAIERHDMAKVRSYLKDEKSVTSWTHRMVSKYGVTPLSIAARENHLDILDHLLSLKADIHAQNDTGATALYGACAVGAKEAVTFLLDRGARADHDKIKYLEEYELYEGTAKIHYSDEDEAIPLLQKALENVDFDVMIRILDTTKNTTDLYPFFQYLCKNNKDIRYFDSLQTTGFHPPEKDLHSIVESALKHNCNTDTLIKLGDFMPACISARALAIIADEHRLLPVYDAYEAKNLIPPPSSRWEFDVIYTAVKTENWGFIDRIKKKGYNIDATNPDGETSLHISIRQLDLYLLPELIEAGAQMSAKNRIGWNAHDYATREFLSSSVKPGMQEILKKYTLQAEDPPKEENKWEKTGEAEVTHITTVKGSGKRITDSFNFKNKERLTIVDDLQMKTQSPIRESFDRVAPHILQSAFDAYKSLGGNDIDEASALSILPPKPSSENSFFDKGNNP